MRARSALFTLFGDVIRPAGGEAWLSTITACMATLDFSGPAVRTALHRMGAEGWVEPRKEGRYAAYRLTERGVGRLEEAASRIYRLRSLDWDGRWRLLLASDLVDAGVLRELSWLGYGRLQPGVWASPHPHPRAASDLVRRTGTAATFVEDSSVADDAGLASRAWPLEELRRGHESFLSGWSDVVAPGDPAAAMGMRLRLVHHWRSFLFTDPGLPAEVLPEDWPGLRAARLFAAVYESLRESSWAHYAQLVRAAPAPIGEGPLPHGLIDQSPFTRGLAAMQNG